MRVRGAKRVLAIQYAHKTKQPHGETVPDGKDLQTSHHVAVATNMNEMLPGSSPADGAGGNSADLFTLAHHLFSNWLL